MKFDWKRLVQLAVAAAWLGSTPAPRAAEDTAPGTATTPPGSAQGGQRVPGSEIFDQPTVLDFQLHLLDSELEALRQHPREYTTATVIVNGDTYHDVAVKLKGAAGSYRPVDSHPAFTLSFNKFAEGRRFYGLRRIHLNNSVQDDTRLNEYLGSELFRAAGIPTPRVAWATVRLNERKLGLYVLKEAFESEFLRLYFGSDRGNLYEGGLVRDIDRDLEKESGKGPDDFSDLALLREAVAEKDSTNRWEKIQQRVDVNMFTTYMALSTMIGDWDGYPLNRNNYRIYFRPSDGRAVWLPHGMDQLFQRSYQELDASWSGSMAWAIFDTPQGITLYEQRCREVLTNVFRVDFMTNTIARASEVLGKVDPHFASNASDLAYRVERRHRNVRRDPFIQPPPTNAVPASAGN